MLLKSTMDDVLLARQQQFLLTATDASKLSRSQFLTVNIQGAADTIDFKKIITFTKSSQFVASGKNTFVEIARKVGNYFNDAGSSFEAIESSRTSEGYDFYQFGNCRIKSTPCDAVAMQKYRQQVNLQSFLNIFEPEFILKSSSNSLTGNFKIIIWKESRNS